MHNNVNESNKYYGIKTNRVFNNNKKGNIEFFPFKKTIEKIHNFQIDFCLNKFNLKLNCYIYLYLYVCDSIFLFFDAKNQN